MGQISPFLRNADGGHAHFCPGCDEMHFVPNSWTFNGNVDKPTFSPSVKITGTQRLTDDEHALIMRGEPFAPKPYCCHYILTDGVLNFCSDCTHALSGQSVPLPPLPREWTDE